MRDAYVDISNLVKAYPNPRGEAIRVVDQFNLRVAKGEVISIIGHSGCGKSTVLTMLAGLNPRSGGDMIVDGHTVDLPGPDRAVVFQAPCLLPWLSALDNVLLGVRQVYAEATRNQALDICRHYLEMVGLADHLHKRPGELSGGQQQRVGIARAVALQPKVLLLDEPFGRLDSLTRQSLQDVILDLLDRQRITTLLITHDVDEAVYMSDRVCMMTNGPRARVGQLLDIPFARPRRREALLEDDLYYDLRASLLDFLEKFDHRHASAEERHSGDSDEVLQPLDLRLSLARPAGPAAASPHSQERA